MLRTNIKIQLNEKFTTASLGCFLRIPLTRHNLAYASLLAKLQMNASLYYPSLKKQEETLLNLYDLQFEVVPQLFGKEIILSYFANFVEPMEVLDPEYNYEKIINTLANIIQHPTFSEDIVDLSKRQLSNEYRELLAEPANYALEQFFHLWYQDQPNYAETFMGPISEIQTATSTSLENFAHNLRTVPSLILGQAKSPDLFAKNIRDQFKHAGLLQNFTPASLTIDPPKKMIDQVDEKQNLQTQLMLGYAYKERKDLRAQVAGLMLVQYLTGDSASILFTKIREQLGAAYAVEANNYANNSLFFISAGVEAKKAERAKKIIVEEIENISQGRIDEDLFKKAKKALINAQLIGQDHQSWKLAQALRQELFIEYQNFDRMDAIKRLTRVQMKKFAQNLSLNESYLLK